jgi:predicted regulator of Ras-like GTPase activity (Roadblock/LC7/MglB family)
MSSLHPHRSEPAQRAAEALLAEIAGASAIVIATADGFELAHAGRGIAEPARIAAMVSSLSALGNAASQEVNIGAPRVLVVESSEGRLVVRCIEARGQSLVVVVLTDRAVLLGTVWHHLADAERLLDGA